MRATKCDRCGEYFDGFGTDVDRNMGFFYLKRIRYGASSDEIDLCQKCQGEFLNWMNGSSNREDENAGA